MPGLLESGYAPGSARGRDADSLVVCLAGNPNVGKSTLFNRLTGSAVETANYPGMTVGLNVAKACWEGRKAQVVDLPGTYALDPTSEDQWVARHGILDWSPDVVVVVVDATNLARNLYIVLQLLDLGCRIVVSLNLMDEARRHSVEIDIRALARELGVPVIPTVARSGEGVRELIKAVLAAAATDGKAGAASATRYSSVVEDETETLVRRLEERAGPLPHGLGARAVALALLEEDSELTDQVGVQAPSQIDPASRGGSLALQVAVERHARAQAIASAVTVEEAARSRPLVAPHHLAPDGRSHPARGTRDRLRDLVLLGRMAIHSSYLGLDRDRLPTSHRRRPRTARHGSARPDHSLGSRWRHPCHSRHRHPLYPDLLLHPGHNRGLRLHECSRLPERPAHARLRPSRPRGHTLDLGGGLQRAGHHGNARALLQTGDGR